MAEESALQIANHVELVKVGDRSVSAHGFRVDLVRQHLEEHLTGEQKWCEVGCLAKTMFGKNIESNRKQIRRRIAPTFISLLSKYGAFLVIQYDLTKKGRGKILAVKLYEHGDGAERQYANLQLDRMHRRRQVTTQIMEQAQMVLGL